ncbi:MAG: octaprenyl diphosphate synthase [Xanthomonadales bacterium]|nr:polyprenyl synthetase family protein [Gammaproteobacteria bacterium]MBT8054676.1 polyprenyl synthetase family protein [Gammaproteobacteria bacterium]NND55766.1 octaprenyl diphosphate synthase [Xanthomonadales bacterium]NNK50177.1 octaprenyl diphosphate synthase [Xanthomonadales bacterium]
MDQSSVREATAAASATQIQHVFDLCADDMVLVNGLIRKSLNSDVVLIRQISEYIIGSGGKRLRPMLVLLAARACGYRGSDHITVAAIIEFIHTATLLHDDVVDESDRRRGQESAHEVWGNAASVLVGDFLYSRSFQMMVTVDSMRVMEVLSDATNTIAEGEVEQLLNMHDPEVSEKSYFTVIEKKTAKLFEAACQLGAVLAGKPELEQPLAHFGRELGAAFQVADDVLDYTADAVTLGKNVGDDLAEGKPTLPLILSRKYLQAEQQALVDDTIRQGGIDRIDQIVDLIRSTGALDETMEVARNRSRAAVASVAALPATDWKDALMDLAAYSVSRRF